VKILYIAVHHHIGWGAEHWMANAFERAGHTVGRFDYRARRNKFKPWWLIRRDLVGISEAFQPDVVLIQRAEDMPASFTHVFNVPVVFWSTAPLNQQRDVDKLLSAKASLAWVYLHSYTCKRIVDKEYPHLSERCSVMHNAGAIENDAGKGERPRFAVFNRDVSPRRKKWLSEIADIVDVRSERLGNSYFSDLRTSQVSINIHFDQDSIDEFETGIFEALASGCMVVTEALNPRTVSDMGMENALIQVESPQQMRKVLLTLKKDPEDVKAFQKRGMDAMVTNRWDARVEQMLEKFNELL